MDCRAVASFVVAMACVLGRPAAAQDQVPAALDSTYETPAHISLIEGAVVLERDGQLDRDPRSMPLLAGDRLRTESGRVEVLFPDGSALHLDAGTIVDFQSDEMVRLLRGRIRLSIAGPERDVFYRIDASSAWVEIHEVGEYRVAAPREGEVELAVLRGRAELVNEQGRTHIRAGEQTFARAGAAPSQPYVFNSAAWDDFDRWSESRRSARLGRSAQYLPGDVRPYAATLDTYGTWRHEAAYGYVWYPRVAVGWRPYYHGRWVSLRPYGWTWVAADPWGWPTHHYGRWGFSAGAWFWIPGRHWGPAWVSWAYTPHYVTWSPLGWNNRPIVQIVNINVGQRFSPWDVWTVVPRRHFSGSYVNVAAIGSVRIDQRVHNTFVIRDRAPETRFAVSRDSAPIRSAGRFAVPRTGTSASASRSVDGGRRLASPGAAATSGERRLPAPARAPGSVTSGRSSGAAPAPASPGGRAVARDADAGVSPNTGSRARSTDQRAPAAGGRAVAREADGAATPAPAWRSRSATPPAAPNRTTGEPATRQAAPAGEPARAAETAPPAGAVRAVPRGSTAASPQAAPAPGRTDAPSAAPGRTRSSAAPSQTAPAAAPARSTAPARTRSSAAPAATPAPAEAPAPPRPSTRSAPPPEGRPEPAPGWGRATPRSQSAPAAPAPRAAPERRAPAASPPAAGPSSRSSDGSAPTAGGSSRQRSAEASSSAPRGRRRE